MEREFGHFHMKLFVLLLACLPFTKECNPQSSDDLYADPKDCMHTAMLRIVTRYPYDDRRVHAYKAQIEKGLHELELYGGVTVPQMGKRTSRMDMRFIYANRTVYGQQHTMSNLKVPCRTLKEFTRKAVSWSNNINQAVLACRCEKPFEVTKLRPIF